MKINTIAEGIETEEQFKLIKELGVNEAQGFLFSKPIPLEDFEKMYLKPVSYTHLDVYKRQCIFCNG